MSFRGRKAMQGGPGTTGPDGEEPTMRNLNDKEIKFAQLVAMGVAYHTAAQEAGIKGYHRDAYKIAKRPYIAEYIDQLREESKERASRAVEEGLKIAYQIAIDSQDVNKICRVVELMAKISGSFNENSSESQGTTNIEYIVPEEKETKTEGEDV